MEFLSNTLLSSLLEFLKFSILLLDFSIEALLIIQKWEPIFHALWLFGNFIFFFIFKPYLSRPQQIYLVDFSCLKPPNFCRVPFSTFLEHAKMLDFLDQENIAFMAKVLTTSGQGERTYLPPAIHYIPPRSDHNEATNEVQMVLFPVFEDLLSKTNLSPQDIDILITNCSGFCPTPSLSSIIINKYSMRDNIKSFNLTGMGCSASALAINMAQNLLKVHKDSYALVLSTEILSTGWYPGKEKPMMVLNCLFRMGSSGILLTNKKQAQKSAKYKLLHSLRSQRAFDDKAYYSAFREEDSSGITGVTLRRDLLHVAGETLRPNIMGLSRSILPVTEIFHYLISSFWKRFIDKSMDIYMPDFRLVIQHFCLPSSGRPVIREIGKGLKLGEREMEAALVTLHRFGNQSSSSLWYELSYLESKERVRKGDKVWQLGMGSGPKCTSLVWECVRAIVGEAQKGPWDDCIDRYPNLAFDKD
ncbi:3-ketoacyl-CoA synthase [Actinidia chinensis var. chinensis]|uniref:3-ketoacyl-CoA synthase n=1 Tax=Actinidia chinensis var. chinensis TaxID=1590841 RepID=A0A2R6RQW7_ACTCC|nr:3-ketoacyl-CoA synthase [Actinidia chinensis var. chinensis]